MTGLEVFSVKVRYMQDGKETEQYVDLPMNSVELSELIAHFMKEKGYEIIELNTLIADLKTEWLRGLNLNELNDFAFKLRGLPIKELAFLGSHIDIFEYESIINAFGLIKRCAQFTKEELFILDELLFMGYKYEMAYNLILGGNYEIKHSPEGDSVKVVFTRKDVIR